MTGQFLSPSALLRPDPGHAMPVWSVTSACPETPLISDTDADLVVVGGGLVGLCVAVAAARRGAWTLVLEGGRLGHGASGRTSGFIAPTLRPLPGGRRIEDVLGSVRARAFRRMSAGSGATVFDLIAQSPVAVPVDRAGWIAASHDAAAMTRLAAEVRDVDTVLDAAQVAAITGIDIWHGGVLHADSGALDPAAFVQGLASLARAAGATVHENSPARLLTVSGRTELRVNGHRVRAGHILIATNALSGEIAPTVARALLSISAWQTVTEPLPAPVRDKILPGRHAVTDTRRNSVALRWTTDGRLLTGGGVGLAPLGDAAGAARRYGRRLARVAGPALQAAGIDPACLRPAQVWSGRIALTRSGLPELFVLGGDVTAVIACNGRGIALGTAVGLALGEALADGLKQGDTGVALAGLPLPIHPPGWHPLHVLAATGARLRVPWADVLDWREARLGQPTNHRPGDRMP